MNDRTQELVADLLDICRSYALLKKRVHAIENKMMQHRHRVDSRGHAIQRRADKVRGMLAQYERHVCALVASVGNELMEPGVTS